MIFDLDPPNDAFELVHTTALLIKEILEKIGLVSFVMTTGSRGLHVVVSLDGRADFDTVRSFSQDLSEVLSRQHPDSLTTEQRKDKRMGRLFLDTFRNGYAQTSVTPYAVRAKEVAPVATPLDWDELGDKNLTSRSYNINNIFDRINKKPDPWKGIFRHRQSLGEPRKLLDAIRYNR